MSQLRSSSAAVWIWRASLSWSSLGGGVFRHVLPWLTSPAFLSSKPLSVPSSLSQASWSSRQCRSSRSCSVDLDWITTLDCFSAGSARVFLAEWSWGHSRKFRTSDPQRNVMGQSTEMSPLASMLFPTFLNPLQLYLLSPYLRSPLIKWQLIKNISSYY